jgi:hypothetical protein
MPNDDPLVINEPNPVDGTPPVDTDPEEENPMAEILDVPTGIQQQALARLSSAGTQAHEHFVTFGKILDLSFEIDRKVVSLPASLGVREVTSQAGQTGIPLAGGIARAPGT